MGKLTFIEHNNTKHVVELEAGDTLMQIAVNNAKPLPIPSKKLGIGGFFMANASARPITIQLVMISPTNTDSCLLIS